MMIMVMMMNNDDSDDDNDDDDEACIEEIGEMTISLKFYDLHSKLKLEIDI